MKNVNTIKTNLLIAVLIFSIASINSENYAGKGIRSSTNEPWQFSATPCYDTVLESTTCEVQQSEINLEKGGNYKEFEDNFKLDNGLALKYEDLGIEFVNNHFKEFQEKDMEISLIYSITISKTNIYSLNSFGEDLILPKAKVLFDKNKQTFIKLCGDLIPERINLTAVLIINLKVVFKDVETKKGFKIGLDFGLKYEGAAIKLTALIEKMAREKNVEGTMKINAKQIGGANPLKLSSILNASGIAQCSIQNATQCDAIIEGIMAYAKTEFVDQEKCNEGSFLLTNIKSSVTSIPVSDLIDSIESKK